MTVAHHGSLIF